MLTAIQVQSAPSADQTLQFRSSAERRVKRMMDNRKTALDSSKGLAVAMMEQAVRDLTNGNGEHSKGAVRWIQNGDTGAFSFALCCQVMGWHPEVTRRLLLDTCRTAASCTSGRVIREGWLDALSASLGVDGSVLEPRRSNPAATHRRNTPRPGRRRQKRAIGAPRR